ncbi:hypothetical protein FOG18_13710 (plasmid) [Legionella israelensis]|uniref:hypothetical protein n=1 Tax=Legionella israelensis TaxID=454 RepID=UPI00117F5463|nr:hypothetical protein [Legionella israelensis]QDP73710.1 hypothetical protein FOG18_13710 [Legionella israelensis]
MNTYEKLIYFASNPNNDFKDLHNKKGELISSSESVIEELQMEFTGNSKLEIDFRQACEVAVFDR